MKALILAGGRGSRLNEFTKTKNKSMIKLFESPLIEYNLNHAVEAEVNEIIIVVGYKKEEIKKYIGSEYKGIPVKYALQREQKGLVNAIECAKEKIGNSDFILMLGDEIIPRARIKEMINKFRKEDLFAVCGIIKESDKLSISKTYSAMINEKGRIFRLIEKPQIPINNIKGTGHCVLKNEIFHYISRTPINTYRGEKEMVDLIQVAVDEGKQIYVYELSDNYININTRQDFILAEEIIKKDNPKVLIVHNQMKFYGGGELLIVELANWLTKKGVKNDILTLSSSKEVERKLINTEIILPEHNVDLKPPGYKNMKDIIEAIKAFRKKLKEIERNYDVVNFHDFPVTWSLWPKKKPAVWFMNLPPNLYSKPEAGFILKLLNKFRIKLDKFIVRKSMGCVVVIEEMNKRRAWKRYRMNAKLMNIGINYDFFSKGDIKRARNKWDLEKRFIIIQSGQITNIKNQFESVKTINNIKNKIPNVLLILAGEIADERYEKKIKEYIKKNELEKYILFTGNLSREDLRDLYKVSNVGLFPIGKQGGVLAPFEALCGGIPIIVSETIETASFIRKNKLGNVTKDYDKLILDIHKNKKKYEEQMKEALKFIKKNMTWKNYSESMLQEFKKVWRKYKK